MKDKGKGILVESDEEEGTIAKALKRKQRDRKHDLNAKPAREAEEKERKKKEAHDLLETRKTLFHLWSV